MPLPLLDAPGRPPGLGAAFTTRAGGVSVGRYASLDLGTHVGDEPGAVTENRARLAAAVGLPAERMAYMNQVHGADVVEVAAPLPSRSPQADALVTRERGLALVVLVADCVPVLLADPRAGVVAAVHAGRPGVVAGVVAAALAAMRDLGASPAAIQAWLGPAVGGCCYEVPAKLQDEVAAVVPATVAAGGRTRWGTPSLDLRAGVRAVLEQAGVAQVRTVGGCTVDEAERSFSYRRDGVTGRQAGVVWLAP